MSDTIPNTYVIDPLDEAIDPRQPSTPEPVVVAHSYTIDDDIVVAHVPSDGDSPIHISDSGTDDPVRVTVAQARVIAELLATIGGAA